MLSRVVVRYRKPGRGETEVGICASNSRLSIRSCPKCCLLVLVCEMTRPIFEKRVELDNDCAISILLSYNQN